MKTNKEIIEELLVKYKIPCSCPKGGLVGENELVCEKCDGSEWVLPDDILEALAQQKEKHSLELITEKANCDQKMTVLKADFKRVVEGKKVKWIDGKLSEEEKERMKMVIDAILDDILKAIKE